MVELSPTYLALYISVVRALLDELNKGAAAGLITHEALPLISIVDRHTRTIERLVNAQTLPSSQQ